MIFGDRLMRAVTDTLFARIALVLVINLVVILASAALLIDLVARHVPYEDPNLPGRIAAAVHSLDRLAPADREGLARGLTEPGFQVRILHGPPGRPPDGSGRQGQPGPPPDGFDGHPPPDLGPPPDGPPDGPPPFDDGEGPEFRDLLAVQLAAAFAKEGVAPPQIRILGDPGAHHLQPGPPRWSPRIFVSLTGGGWAEFRAHRWMPPLSWYPLLVLAALVCVVVSVMSLIVARSFSRHLAGFAGAAEAFGRSADAPPLAESGPREIRLATRAFNRMQERLRRYVKDRTQMLAAISHDLRTPLTRLRLRAEFVEDDEQREKMLQDIADMEAMIRETLAFARDDGTREPRQPEDLDQLLEDFCTVMREAGQDVSYTPSGPAVVSCSPTAIRRALGNLLDNAVYYGQRARVTLIRAPGQITIQIDDDGPGIPAAMQEQVFQPFFRLEGSRSRDTGGVGLGMAVARTILRGHGGDVTLANRPGGGLRVTVTLPA